MEKEEYSINNPVPNDQYNAGQFEGAWIGVDLDGTLAYYGPENMRSNVIGDPVPKMMERVREWQARGMTIKLFTARACLPEQIPIVEAWLEKHNLEMEITNVKDFNMIELWDDRAIQIIPNTGDRADGNK